MSVPIHHATDLEVLTILGLNPGEADEIERGLPYATCEHLARNLDMRIEKLSQLLQITYRPEEGRLRSDESERLLNVARAYGRVLRFFNGDAEAAQRWMMKPALAFSETKPIEVATTESGARAVERLMDQLDYGVYP